MHFALNPISALHCLEGEANVAAASGLCLLTCFEASLFALHSILPVAGPTDVHADTDNRSRGFKHTLALRRTSSSVIIQSLQCRRKI